MSAISECVRGLRLLALDVDGVLTSNDVWIDEQGRELTRWWRGDGLGLEAVVRAGVQVAVVSGEDTPGLRARLDRLPAQHRLLGRQYKVADLWELLRSLTFHWSDIAYLGNDVNDADCLISASLPICVADAHPDVLPLARYVTRAKGGYGAVREVCDLIVRVKGSKE